MKESITYCKSWFRAKKKPTEIWAKDKAKEAHLSKRLYTALVGPVIKPSCFLEINDKFVGVGFLDEEMREYLYYAFKEVEPGKLFLTTATYREFEGGTDKVLVGTTYNFSQDGKVKVHREHFNPHKIEDLSSSADMSGNYSAWPEFGEYDDLIQIERGSFMA